MKKTTDFIFNGTELDIQNHIVENINDICDRCFLGSVKNTLTNLKIKGQTKSSGIYDILIYHTNGTGTIIEVKKYTSDMHLLSAIGQILYYAELCEIQLTNYPRLIIASNFIQNSIRAIIKANKLPIRILEVDGNKVTFY